MTSYFQDLTDNFNDNFASQNEIGGFDEHEPKKSKKDPDATVAEGFVDTAGYMDMNLDDIDNNFDDNYQDDDWEPETKPKVNVQSCLKSVVTPIISSI